MSLKQLRKKATEGARATCPACGENVPLAELTSGRHVANSCAPFKQSALDAKNPKLQARLQKDHDQSKLVMKKQTWSERNWSNLETSDFIRQYWMPSVVSLMLLTFAIGWESPQGSGELSLILDIAVGPLVFFGGTYLMFKGKLRWLRKLDPRRRKNDETPHS